VKKKGREGEKTDKKFKMRRGLCRAKIGARDGGRKKKKNLPGKEIHEGDQNRPRYPSAPCQMGGDLHVTQERPVLGEEPRNAKERKISRKKKETKGGIFAEKRGGFSLHKLGVNVHDYLGRTSRRKGTRSNFFMRVLAGKGSSF